MASHRQNLIDAIQLFEEIARRHKNTLALRRFHGLYDWQSDFIAATRRYFESCLCAGNQIGKAQPLSEPVLTPTGFRPMGDIKAGHKVIGSDGKPVTVLQVFPQGLRTVYEVSFTDGATVRCDGEHLWRIKQFKAWRTLTTLELMRDFKPGIVPARTVYQFGHSDPLPIDPYFLGLLLGDGHLGNGITISTPDAEIIEYCRQQAPLFNTELKHRSRYDYAFVSHVRTPGGHGRNDLKHALKALGLQGKLSSDKFIPAVYKNAGPDQRLALLQGLMDTDGTASLKGARLYCSVSRKLAKDVQFLARSLGIDASFNIKKRQSGLSFEVVLYKSEESVFRLQRKQQRELTGESRNMRMIGIRRLETPELSQCITVDAPDHLYITADFIPTHNTFTGTLIDGFHVSGDYPDNYPGHRFDFAPMCWGLGYSMEKTRDLLQKPLFGDYSRESGFSGGLVPKDRIVDFERVSGTPNAMRTVRVKHATGDVATIQFWSYSQGQHAIMGDVVDWFHIDEEPVDPKIRPQVLTRSLNGDRGKGGRGIYTFTPENGRTELVIKFMDEPTPAQFFMKKGWDDAPHMTEEKRERLLEQFPKHQREMRSKGEPMLGHGRIYDLSDEVVECEPFEIPDHFQIINGMDFGWDHPQAFVQLAIDRDNDITYVTHSWKQSMVSPNDAWGAVNRWVKKYPVAWPHDGLQHERASRDSRQLKENYLDAGFQFLFENARWPDGSNSVETGLFEIIQAARKGNLKIFRGQGDLMNEWRQYHRDERGKIVKVHDDILDALRYAWMCRRYAVSKGSLNQSQKIHIPRALNR